MGGIMDELKYKNYTIKINQDNDPMNPRTEFDNLGTMVCYHSRYELGDKKHDFIKDPEGFKQFLKDNADNIIALPLYLLDHSGLWIRTARFHEDPGGWDTSMLGFIYITKEKARKEYGWKHLTPARVQKLREYLEGEVEIYNQYLTGDVYGYQVFDKDGEDLYEACYGFFGSDHEKSGLLEQAHNAIDCDINHTLKTEGIQEELVLV
jgi:hypothetical protein